ncbi:MAG: hypothetical protein ABJD11_16930 [Gemmatimonadota bacterium]
MMRAAEPEPALPPGWALVALGDVATLAPGLPKSRAAPSKANLRLCISANHLAASGAESPPIVIAASARAAAAGPLREGDLLVPIAQGTPAAAIWRGSAEARFLDSSLIRIRPDATLLDSRFLQAHLRSVTPAAGAKPAAKKATTARSRIAELSRHQLQLPPLVEQRRRLDSLAEFEQHLTLASARLSRVPTRLGRYSELLVRLAVTGELVEPEAVLAVREGRDFSDGAALITSILAQRPSLAPPVSRKRTAKAKAVSKKVPPSAEAPLPPAPPGWAWSPLQELLAESLIHGRAPSKSSISAGTPVVTPEGVIAGDFSERFHRFTDAPRTRLAGLWLEPGDVLIVRTGSIDSLGRTAVYSGPSQYAVFTDSIFRARFSDLLIPAFMTLSIGMSVVRESMLARARPAPRSLFTLDSATAGSIPLLVAPRAEQERIVTELGRRQVAIDGMHRSVQMAARRAGRLEWTMLGRALSGTPTMSTTP